MRLKGGEGENGDKGSAKYSFSKQIQSGQLDYLKCVGIFFFFFFLSVLKVSYSVCEFPHLN